MSIAVLDRVVNPINSHRSARVRSLDVWRGSAILLLLVGHFSPFEGSTVAGLASSCSSSSVGS
jgi:hypothetical protein